MAFKKAKTVITGTTANSKKAKMMIKVKDSCLSQKCITAEHRI